LSFRALVALAAAAGIALACGSSSSGSSVVLVPAAASWRFTTDLAQVGPDWTAAGFDDSAWREGRGPLGFGEGDEGYETTNPDEEDPPHLTVYFRHRFQVPDPASVAGLRVQLVRDDGAAVHLNGTEVLRSNLPPGPLAADTPAPLAIGSVEEHTATAIPLDPSLLQAGENVIAAEVHQNRGRSSDLRFQLVLQSFPETGRLFLDRGPYLQSARPDEMTVRFRTNRPVVGRVRFGPAPDQLSGEVVGEGPSLDHTLVLTGLAPDTRTYYAVGSEAVQLAGADDDHWFVTPPPAGSRQPTRFWALGDGGSGTAEARGVRDGFRTFDAEQKARVFLTMGDNAYPSGSEIEYQAAFFNTYPSILRRIPVWPTLGNHDTKSSSSKQQSGPYYEAFHLPTQGESGGVPSGSEAFYSFDHGNIHFVSVDSAGSSRAPIGPMLTWLKQDLAATEREWVVVYHHHPAVSRGSHKDEDKSTQMVRERMVPLYHEAGADLVLSGHSHSYERSFLLGGTLGPHASFSGDAILDPSLSGEFRKSGGRSPGTLYVVAGHGSIPDTGPLDHPAIAFARGEDVGSLVVDVNGCLLTGRAIDERGRLIDEFTLEKTAPCS